MPLLQTDITQIQPHMSHSTLAVQKARINRETEGESGRPIPARYCIADRARRNPLRGHFSLAKVSSMNSASMNSASLIRRAFFFLLAFTLIEAIDQIDPALRQGLLGGLVDKDTQA